MINSIIVIILLIECTQNIVQFPRNLLHAKLISRQFINELEILKLEIVDKLIWISVETTGLKKKHQYSM